MTQDPLKFKHVTPRARLPMTFLFRALCADRCDTGACGGGRQPVPLPTALMSTHTGGYTGFSMLDTTHEMRATRALEFAELDFDAVYTGFRKRKAIDIIAGA